MVGTWRIGYVNNSNKSKYFIMSNLLPDTLLPIDRRNSYRIEGNETGFYQFKADSRQEFVNSQPQGKVCVFILEADTVLKYGIDAGWQILRNNNLYLKRIEKTAAELENENWTITYP
jgi:hypothetical protein